MAKFETKNDQCVFIPTVKHGIDSKQREEAVAWALRRYCGPDGRIPEQMMAEAVRQGVLAGGRTWCNPRVRVLANMLQMTPPPDRSRKDLRRVDRRK